MSTRTIQMTDKLYDYMQSMSVRDHPLLKRLREETAALPRAGMQISPEQGALMALLVKLMGAKKTLEIGTFTGYSSLCVAMALPDDGRMIACDVNDEWTQVARRYWAEAGVAHKIELRLGPGVETLSQLISEGESDTFDFAFIDADKTSYDAYYERCLKLVRPGGLIAIDNIFQGGRIVDEESDNESVQAVRALNEKLHADSRIDMCIVPIGDGLTLARKR